jgi:hypothetical protein
VGKNMIGLGFSFGAVDAGFTRVMGSITSAASKMTDSFASMTGGINLTAGLEGEIVGTSKSVREMGANFGRTGKDLDKFTSKATSMSIGLNIGADQAALALRGWQEAGSELGALGFKSATELAKFTSAFGVNADTLRNSSLMMRNEFGLSDKEINRVVSSTVEMGQQTGDVAGALNELPQAMTRMRDQASLMGVEIDRGKLVDFAAQTNALASGFMKIGQTSDDARAKSSEMATAFLAAERQFEGMFAGVQTEMPEFIKELAITTGTASSAFEIMEKGPAGFASGMAMMVAEAKKNGTLTDKQLTFVGARMEKVLGDQASANLINFFRKADAETIKSMNTTEHATENLAKLGKEAFRTGRTMADSLEFAKDRMFTSFRALGKPAARKWLKQTQQAFGQFTNQLKGAVKDGGPMGQFISKLSEASSIGAQAFVPQAMRPITMVMDTFLDQMGPTIDSLGKLGINFTSLGGIVSGVATTVGLFAADVALNKKATESWGDAIGLTAEKWSVSFVDSIRTAGMWVQNIATWIKDVNFGKIFDLDEAKPASAIGTALKAVREAFNEFDWAGNFEIIIGKSFQGFSAVFTTIMANPEVQRFVTWMHDLLIDTVVGAFNAVPWKAIGTFMKSQMTLMFKDSGWATQKLLGIDKDDIKKAENDIYKFQYNLKHKGDKSPVAGRINKQLAAEGKLPFDREANRRALKTGQSGSAVAADMSESLDQVQSFADAAPVLMENAKNQMSEPFEASVHTAVENDMMLSLLAVESMAETAQGMLYEMMHNFEAQSQLSFENMTVSAEGFMASLQAVANMQGNIVDTDTAMSGGGSSLTPSGVRDKNISKLTTDEAIHTPLWYAGSAGYERLFTAKMNHLITAVQGMQGSTRNAPAAKNGGGGPIPRTAKAPSRSRTPAGSKAR